MHESEIFSRLMDEYGNLEVDTPDEGGKSKKRKNKGASGDGAEENEPKKGNNVLMTTEERETGAVTWSVYKQYLRFAGGVVWAPIILLLLTLAQAAQGMHPLIISLLSLKVCSGQQSVSRILDGGEHSRLPTGGLHGYIRCPRYGGLMNTLLAGINLHSQVSLKPYFNSCSVLALRMFQFFALPCWERRLRLWCTESPA